MNNLLLLALALLVVSCGENSPLRPLLKQLSPPRSKRIIHGSILEGKSAFTSGSRILKPRTPEEFAINEFQDYADVHQGWSKIGYATLNDQPEIATADKPKTYSPKIILSELDYIKKEMPKELLNIYQRKIKFPEGRVFDPKVLEYWGRKINGGSDKARRWQQKMLPNLAAWSKESIKDVRGYMFFKDMNDVQIKLDNFSSQEYSFQEKSKVSLINICMNNNQNRADCEQEVIDSIHSQKVYPLFANYITKAKEIYDNYFKLRVENPEGHFVDNIFNLTMTRPKDDAFAFLFKSIIERNWTVEGKPIRKLALNYTYYPKPDPTSVEVRTNEISHVENFRKMIIDTTLDEFTLGKTLTHEFGHVLGFIDCYVEFYDEVKAEAVYYEIDSQNIMCSLNGQVTEQHYEALLKNY